MNPVNKNNYKFIGEDGHIIKEVKCGKNKYYNPNHEFSDEKGCVETESKESFGGFAIYSAVRGGRGYSSCKCNESCRCNKNLNIPGVN